MHIDWEGLHMLFGPCIETAGEAYLGIAKVAYFQQGPCAILTVSVQQQILKLEIPVGHALQIIPALNL